MDDSTADLISLIDRFGWAVRFVSSGPEDIDAPPFGYTVGLTAFGHPEFVMTGLPQEDAHAFLNQFGAAVRDGRRFQANTLTTEMNDRSICLRIFRTQLLALSAGYVV